VLRDLWTDLRSVSAVEQGRPVHPTLAAAAHARGGVFTWGEALAAGYSVGEVRARLASGRWRRIRRGMYAAGGADAARRLAAAVVASLPGAVLSHRSAAVLHSLPVWGRDDGLVHVVLPGGRSRRRHGVHVHATPCGTRDIVEVGQLPVTSRARTAVDLAATLELPHAVAVVDAVLRSRPSEKEHMDEIASGRGRRVRRVLELADGRAESPGESLSRVAIASHGLPTPQLQQWVGDADEPIGRVDFLWPDVRTVGEFDGRAKYASRDDLWAEKLREDRLRTAGFEVVRWVWADVVGDFAPVAARLSVAFARGRRS
jgi:Transcriptional regulator, AbiEi antitoxin